MTPSFGLRPGMVGRVYHGEHVAIPTRVPIQSAQKPYAAFNSPYLEMLYKKFDLNWPTNFRDILL